MSSVKNLSTASSKNCIRMQSIEYPSKNFSTKSTRNLWSLSRNISNIASRNYFCSFPKLFSDDLSSKIFIVNTLAIIPVIQPIIPSEICSEISYYVFHGIRSESPTQYLPEIRYINFYAIFLENVLQLPQEPTRFLEMFAGIIRNFYRCSIQ